MSEFGNLVIAVSKVQDALRLGKDIPPDDRAEINEMLLKVKGNTINLDLTETPISLLTELLKLQDLSLKQRKTMFLIVAGKSGNEEGILDTEVTKPGEFHNAMVSLAGGDKADGPNGEVKINGRWYPVHLTSEFFKSNGFWGDSCSVTALIKVGDVSWSYRWGVTEGSFEDDNGESQTFTVRGLMDKLGLRPLETDMQDFMKLTRTAERTCKRTGKVLAVKGPVLVHSKQNWHTGVDSLAYGAEDCPKKVVIESSLEATHDNGYYGRGGDKATALPFVRVFLLDRKRYAYADVRDCDDYSFDTTALDRLVLEPKIESLLKRIFNSDTSKLFGDLITGKHGGVIILANGTTGVGKTLTAEVFAENTKRPLYTLEMGELGTSLHEVEQNLTLVFHRAARWNAVLLMDEADVFMARRDDNLERSAIVGVFLRLLDYYPGLFFLTTNRADVIDPAFASRIAIQLDYPDLNKEKRLKIWTTMLSLAKIELTNGIDGIPDLNLNGRNIRNIVRIAKIIHPGTKNAEGIEGVSKITSDDLREVCNFTPMAALGKKE